VARYIVRRVLQGVLTLFLVFFLLHVLATLAIQVNGNPALAFFGDKVPTQAQLQAVKQRYHLDDPCYEQLGNPCLGPFVERLNGYLHGDFGSNLRGDQAVTEMVATAAPNTLRLFVVVTLTWLTAGMLLGSFAARFRGRPPDQSIRFLSILIDAFPVFVMLLVYKYIFAVPIQGWIDDRFGHHSLPSLMFKPSFDPDNPWATVIVPGLLLGVTGSAAFIRLVRASQLENYHAEYVRTARAKGLGEARVTVVHIVRNSSIPVVTAVGFVFAEALAGAVITEGLMNIYGMGGLLWRSVRDSEVSVVVGVVSVLAVVILVVNVLVDIAYAVLDPRIRYD
jgi:ABC-type dipeptide/oligopeptide/nickel transport system permease component